MSIKKEVFGHDEVSGQEVHLYTLCQGGQGDKSVVLQCTNYGATITSLMAPDSQGLLEDVTLCHKTLTPLQDGNNRPYYGCVAGRFANRIRKGQFSLDGQTYQLAVNNGVNHLHGGVHGFDRKVWKATEVQEADRVGVLFEYVSADGEEHYPGTLTVSVGYFLTANNDLDITYHAQTDAATIVNLTNHTYWNLSGNCKDNLYNHHLSLNCPYYLPVDATQIPTGEFRNVKSDPHFDFTSDDMAQNRVGKKLGDVLLHIDGAGRPGLDHCFVVDSRYGAENMTFIGCLSHPNSGRSMLAYTTQPGVQIYSGNWLNNDPTLNEASHPHNMHYAICLETQHFPDSVNIPSFPSVVLRLGQVYQHKSRFCFRTL